MTYERDTAFHPRDLADYLEYRTERAAIVEFLGGRTRDEADRAAAEMAGPMPGQAEMGGVR